MKKVILPLIFAMIFLASSVFAYFPCDWTTYGGELTTSPNAQYYFDCKSRFNTDSVLQDTYTSGSAMSSPVQVLVAGLGAFEQPRVISQNGNYLQIINEDMDIVTEYNVGTGSGQIDVGDFDNNGLNDDIAGLWFNNATEMAFRVYKFDEIADTLTLQHGFNFTYGANQGSNGVRCVGVGSGDYDDSYCWTVLYTNNGSYQYALFKFYTNGSYQAGNYIGNSTYAPTEPVSYTDYDNDGKMEVLTWSFDRIFLMEISASGVASIERQINYGGQYTIRNAKFMFPLESQDLSWLGRLLYPNANKGRLVYVRDCTYFPSTCECGGYSSTTVTILKPDGSTQNTWCSGSSNSGNFPRTSGMAIADYNGDGRDDVWTFNSQTGGTTNANIQVHKGDDGTLLYSSADFVANLSGGQYPTTSLTIAHLTPDSTYDAILMSSGSMLLYDVGSSRPMLKYTDSFNTCIPADLTFDGFQDIVCSRSGETRLFSVNSTNQNSVLTQVTLSPSSIVAVGSTVDAFMTATDDEGDQIYYSADCGNGVNVSESTSNVKSCEYDLVGIYNATYRVHDIYHPTEYSSLNALITVTSTGSFCNSNSICESDLGETTTTCPADCPTTPDEITSVDGTSIPTKLVDATDEEAGLFPLVYRSMLTFFSAIFIPLIVIVFGIFTALIIITIFGILKKLVNKIG